MQDKYKIVSETIFSIFEIDEIWKIELYEKIKKLDEENLHNLEKLIIDFYEKQVKSKKELFSFLNIQNNKISELKEKWSLNDIENLLLNI